MYMLNHRSFLTASIEIEHLDQIKKPCFEF